jgi:pimeloyl-ACP methyl ester carboxylesterase
MSTRDVPAAALARTRLGSGPGLLLAHGAGSSTANTYGPILEGLAARHTVVGIDYPGSGDTPVIFSAVLQEDRWPPGPA